MMQACEVLKVGLPTRVPYAQIEEGFKKVVPAEILKKFETRFHDKRALIRGILWAFEIDSNSYALGNTRLFFRTGMITAVEDLLKKHAKMELLTKGFGDTSAKDLLQERLRAFVIRGLWRKACAVVRGENCWRWLLVLVRRKEEERKEAVLLAAKLAEEEAERQRKEEEEKEMVEAAKAEAKSKAAKEAAEAKVLAELAAEREREAAAAAAKKGERRASMTVEQQQTEEQQEEKLEHARERKAEVAVEERENKAAEMRTFWALLLRGIVVTRYSSPSSNGTGSSSKRGSLGSRYVTMQIIMSAKKTSF
jgi:myosin heavy subunit